MRRSLLMSLCLAVAGCAYPYTPLVDMNGVNPVVYERDLAACQATAQTPYPAGAIAVGMVIGASVGAGLGAIIAPLSGAANFGLAESTGALSGGAAGAVPGAAGAIPGAATASSAGQTQSVDDCLAAHGYKLLTHRS